MGNAPQIKAELEKTRKRKWYLDTESGEIKPEPEPVTTTAAVLQPEPESVQAAYYTYD